MPSRAGSLMLGILFGAIVRRLLPMPTTSFAVLSLTIGKLIAGRQSDCVDCRIGRL
jgi:hypothetical protein